MSTFRFKQFAVDDEDCGMKVGTDSVLLGAWTDVSGVRNAVDVGAGSGVLALMVAQRAPSARVVGVEVDEPACVAARHNYAASVWAHRLECVHADANDWTPSVAPDLMISNPPFYAEDVLSPDATRSQARYAGTGFGPEQVVRLAARWLDSDGTLSMVTPVAWSDRLMFAAELARLCLWRRCLVSTVVGKRPSRVLWQFARRRRPVELTTLDIRQPDNRTYTPEYVQLTRDYYLNL